MRKKQLKPAVEIWVDDAFAVNDVLTCRLRGDVARPDSACMTLLFEGAEEEGPMTMRLTGLAILKNFASQLNEFLSRMESAGTH